MEEGDLEAAAFWYRAALSCRIPRSGAFVSPDAYGYIPLMQLCVLYDRMGKTELAARMNERALLLCPEDQAALSNRDYFARALKAAEKREKSECSVKTDGQEG